MAMKTDQIVIHERGVELLSMPHSGKPFDRKFPREVEFLVTLPEGEVDHLRLQDLSSDETDGVLAWLGDTQATIYVSGGEHKSRREEDVIDLIYGRHQFRKNNGDID